jgi:hypothetical protein
MLIAIAMTVRGIGFTCGVSGPSATVSSAFDPKRSSNHADKLAAGRHPTLLMVGYGLTI